MPESGFGSRICCVGCHLVIQDHDQDSTDLMKCVHTLQEKEKAEEQEVCFLRVLQMLISTPGPGQYEIIILGGLGGRLDQTVHTLSYLHKLRRMRGKVFVVTDDNASWVLDEVDKPNSSEPLRCSIEEYCRENIVYESTTIPLAQRADYCPLVSTPPC